MKSWEGCKQGDKTHKKILDEYNNYIKAGKAPEASKYIMPSSAPWCATTVSAAFIKAGYGDKFPVECSCGRMIEIAKRHGWWQESDSYRAKPGDCLIYDWSDSGVGDDITGHDHIGMIADLSGDTFTVIEGNMGDFHVCGTRKKGVNSIYIRGFVTPPFDQAELYHTVKEGEYLTKIGKQYGVSWKSIADLNGIKFPYTIYIGEKLRIK